jgi:O-methyltransferase
VISTILGVLGYELRRVGEYNAPAPASAPGYHPWRDEGGEFEDYYELARPRTLVSADRCYVLYRLMRQAMHLEGDVWECGVYAGGTAALLAALLRQHAGAKKLYLFDTFDGMPEVDAGRDLHARGDFANTSLESVQQFVGGEPCVYRKGRIPETFAGLEDARIALAHIDVDIYHSVMDSLTFIWPRLTRGGFLVMDDYGFPTCPGARAATDEFFADKTSLPLCLPTGQAVIFKGS